MKELAEPSMSQTIPFLDLPFKIRQLLYKGWFLVDSELCLDHKREGRDKTQAWNGPPIPVALLRTCATIYNEAAPFLYENNRFVTFAQPSWPESMLEMIGPTPRGHITVLRLDMAASSISLIDIDSPACNASSPPPSSSPDTALWRSLKTHFSQLKTVALSFPNVQNHSLNDRAVCFIRSIVQDEIAAPGIGPETTQFTVTAIVLREPLAFVGGRDRLRRELREKPKLGPTLARRVANVSAHLMPSQLGPLTMCMRYAGCGLVPTSLPAGGFFVVGSKVELAWQKTEWQPC